MDPSKIFDTGFTVVYEPDDPTRDPPLVDIVLIHGLQGHPYRTWASSSPADQSGNSPARTKSSASVWAHKGSIGRKLLLLFKKLRRDRPDTASPRSGPDSVTSVFWPADLLPRSCPRARILVWGYDTRVTRPLGQAVNKSNIFSQGKDLLFAFRRERDLDVPVIFVAHSLGGIVLKEALTGSYNSGEPDLENIARSTKAVIFMGTPHRGSKDMAGVGDIARRVAGALMIDTNSAMLDSLGLKNSDIERCQDSFAGIWRNVDFMIKTFQEGMPLAGINLGMLNEKVVPDFSSLLGDPREHAETLQANHMEMCRFQSELDPNYRKVGGELKRIYGSIINTHFTQPSEPHTEAEWYRYSDHEEQPKVILHPKNCEEVRALLYFPQLGQRYRTIEAAWKSTCQQSLESSQYQAWLNRHSLDQHEGLLWIKGKPGSGKSTLMKEAVRQARMLAGPHNQGVVSFFFNARGHDLEKSTVGFFRGLLHQLFPIFQRRIDELLELYHHRPGKYGEVAWDLQVLRNILRAMFQQPCETPIFMFVDAVDECMGDGPRDIVQFLRELSTEACSADVNLNICMSSRHYPTVTIGCFLELVLEDYNHADIKTFVKKKLSMTTSGSSSTEVSHWTHIANEIIQRASGIFLWARLVLDGLLAEFDKGASIKSLERRLASVPQELEDLYTQILTGILVDERDQAAKLFSWVLLAFRPIKLREWYQLVAFIGKDPPASLAEWKCSEGVVESDSQLERQVRRISRGLVELQKHEWTDHDILIDEGSDSVQGAPGSLDLDGEGSGTLQFIHESVREFFLQGDGFNPLFANSSRKLIGDAHLSILTTCFDYLAVKELDTLAHGRRNAQPGKNASASSSLLVAPPCPRQWNGETKFVRKRRSIESMTSFHSVAPSVGSSASNFVRGQFQHLEPHVEPVLERDDPSRPVEPLLANSRRLSESVEPVDFSYLLNLNRSQARETPFEAVDAASIAHSVHSGGKILEEIPCLFYYASEMIIYHAVSAEREGCNPSKLIDHLQQGEYWARWVSFRDDMTHDTSMAYFAAEYGLCSWLQYLLYTTADINAAGGKYSYPLIAAAHNGQKDVLLFLLKNGADHNAWDAQYRRALHHLAAFGDQSLLMAVFEQCRKSVPYIYVDARDLNGQTALHVASGRADKNTVEVLVKHRANVNIGDKSHNTPLMYASSRHDQNLDIIGFLVESGADVKKSDIHSNTPLDVAIKNRLRRTARWLRQHEASLKARGQQRKR